MRNASCFAVAAATLMLGVAACAAAPLASPSVPFPAARSLVPFIKHPEVNCDWKMHDRSEKWIRGGISRGEVDPMLHLVDDAFHGWSDAEDHKIEISVGDPARRVAARGWADTGGESPGSIAFYMGAELRQLIGGATSLQVWKDGRPLFNAQLSGTPTAAELDACVQPPDSGHSDEE